MGNRVEKLLETLPARGSIEDLGLLIEAIRNVLEVEHVAYLAFSLGWQYSLSSKSGSGPLKNQIGSWWRHNGAVGAVTYNPEWGARYAEEDYQRIDPVVEGAMSSFMPLDWKTLDWSSPKRRKLLREAVDCGIGNQGYTVPVRGPDGQFAIFVLNNSCSDDHWDKFLRENAGDILIIAHFFHQKVLDIEKLFGDTPTPRLSARELDVLKHLATGKNRAQVAHEMKISENTLRVYIDSARHKLGALNITHAVAIGVNRGIVNI
jgi:DNA-binding CsgD family transcriptional regulator